MSARALLMAGLLMLLASAAPPLWGHTMNVGQITLKVVDQRVNVALTLHASKFPKTDMKEIAAEIERNIRVSDGVKTQALKGILVSQEETDHLHEGGPVLLIIGVALFEREPAQLELAVTPAFLRRSGPLKAIASRKTADGQTERRTTSITPNRPSQRLLD